MLKLSCVIRGLQLLQVFGRVLIWFFLMHSIGFQSQRGYSQELATSQTEVGKVTSDVVEALSKQLDATKESERDAAEKALWELGPEA